MPVNTVSVATAVTPTVIETYFSHYLNRRPLRQKPTAHISYHEGLELIRRFLHYASFHTVDEIQAFTSQWVPAPTWVHVKEVDIPEGQLARSAAYIQAQLGPEGVHQIGGKTWWQWRRDNAKLKAEWIEMRKDYDERKKIGNQKGQRIMLYVHGGAYYFGSVDEHRYQMQRHARKLKARVLAPRYRLAPQFPFPCGLQDCLAAYLYLLEEKFDPSTIILAGDSAGGGMVLSILVTLRDQGIPLPAGAILISPWVDLTHSFPSLGGDGKLDYIPAHGFVHKPSMSWPPPNADDILEFERSPRRPQEKETRSPRISLSRPNKEERTAQKEEKEERVRGFTVTEADGAEAPSKPTDDGPHIWVSTDGKYSVGPKSNPILSVQLDKARVEIKDQIQMYAPNHLLTHPLVSPVLQPTLGGLPPLLILTGGGELLRDEQIYLAHKAAQPLAYLPPPSNNLTAEDIEAQASKYRPTNVQLQVWDDLCHVAPTLSFTRPAKHMYRSIAQFGAWALARAQNTAIDIMDDDDISIVSSGGSSVSSATTQPDDKDNLSPEEVKLSMPRSAQHVGFESIDKKVDSGSKVGKAGDALPSFERHMIRQRVDRNGHIYPLAPTEELVALNLPTVEIGVPKPGPVNKWMKAQKQWNGKFARQKLKVQRKRLKDMESGYEQFEGEKPPPTALAGRQVKGMKKEKAKKKSWGMAMWSLWGSKHDEMTLDREEKADQAPSEDLSSTVVEPTDGSAEPKSAKTGRKGGLAAKAISRSRSRSRTVTDKGQVSASNEELRLNQIAPPIPGFAEATVIAPERKASPLPSPRSELSLISGAPTPGLMIDDHSRPQSPQTLIPATDTLSTRPTRGGVAYPFSLKVDGEMKDVNASTMTLQSVNVQDGGIAPMMGISSALDPHTNGDENATAPVIGSPGAAENENGVSEEIAEKPERPAVERFVTAGVGDLQPEQGDKERQEKKVERPGVERFETAQEDLSTLADGSKN